jgi:hypothetical protein
MYLKEADKEKNEQSLTAAAGQNKIPEYLFQA